MALIGLLHEVRTFNELLPHLPLGLSGRINAALHDAQSISATNVVALFAPRPAKEPGKPGKPGKTSPKQKER